MRKHGRMTRRSFLHRSGSLASLGVLGAGIGCSPEVSESPARPDEEVIPVALQLYSVRDEPSPRFPEVLEAVAGMGYEGVEFAGYHGFSAPELRRIMVEVGLRSAGSHVRLAALQGDEFERTVEFNQALGSLYLVVPFHAETRPETLDGWRQVADTFNQISQRLEPHGIRVGYHNFDAEFRPVEGDMPWQVCARSTNPEVTLQLDTAAATRGGGDVLALLSSHPGRFHTVHLEDHSPEGTVVLPGDGVVPFEEVLDFCITRGGTEWFIIEQEQHPPGYTSLESVRECLRRIRSLLAKVDRERGDTVSRQSHWKDISTAV
jgi:sugar phosphate isomerase/epimerase